jgi:hypothetical protein
MKVRAVVRNIPSLEAMIDDDKIMALFDELVIRTMTDLSDWRYRIDGDTITIIHPRLGSKTYPRSRFTRAERSQVQADVKITCEGSLVFFAPLNEAAAEFMNGHFSDAAVFNNAIVVEHQHADEMVELLRSEGFEIS